MEQKNNDDNLRNALISSALVALLLFMVACESDEIPPKFIVTTPCDTNNVSYAKVIEPMLKDNCYSCHSNATQKAGINLEGYDKVKVHALTGKLIGSLSGSMYKYIINDCNVLKIQAWINQGIQNN
jgi:hypothetical protein